MATLNTQQLNSLDSQNRGRSAGQSAPQVSSHNPFRRSGNSPGSAVSPPTSPFDDPIEEPRPVSRNPFLDPSRKQATAQYSSRSLTDRTAPMATSSSKPDVASATAEELFDALTIDDKDKPAQSSAAGKAPVGDGASSSKPGPSSGPNGRPRPPMGRGGPPGPRGPPRGPPGPRGENMPPRFRGPPGHRPSHSQEEAFRARRGPPGAPYDPTSPHRRMERRPRRNSDSSLVDNDKPLTEEEKKAREARRQERERRHRDAKDRPKPVNKKLDLIDQLDATSIYGTGLFHHDGPFDAVNPHRNRPGSRRAPMQAFPKDSLNNSIGGPGPVNARPDHATFMGTAGEEAYKDFTSTAPVKDEYHDSARYKAEMPVFDPLSRGSILHGDQTLGLGTSTFLEGTPATRVAIQRREAETKQDSMDGNIKRNKSIAQRIRNINRGPRDFQPSGRMTNPEGVYPRRSPDAPGQFGPATTIPGERNPFFDEFEPKKDDVITVARRASDVSGPKSPASPKRVFGLERRSTAEAGGNSGPAPEESAAGSSSKGGASSLLARVKSLKGGRKQPPRTNDRLKTPPGPTSPGTAV